MYDKGEKVSNKLGERKHIVLIGAIDDYIKDASPITSGNVKENHIQNISTATLRNELSTLEAMGYLRQMHTSGGRIPTAQGYRYYVNNLLQDIPFDESALDEVKELLEERTKSLSEIVSGLANLVSKAVNYPTVIFMNGYENLIIDTIKIFPLVNKQALTLIQTSSGYITNTIQVSSSLNYCDDASNYLTQKFKGKTIGSMLESIEKNQDNMLAEIENFKVIVNNLIDGIRRVLENSKFDISHKGSAELLSESGETSEQTKKVLKLLDDKEALGKALELEKNQDDLTITLVEENNFSGCALVKAPICVDGKTVASIGVLGPQRMNYAGIASALKVVMYELNNRKSSIKENNKKNFDIKEKSSIKKKYNIKKGKT